MDFCGQIFRFIQAYSLNREQYVCIGDSIRWFSQGSVLRPLILRTTLCFYRKVKMAIACPLQSIQILAHTISYSWIIILKLMLMKQSVK